MKMNSSEARRHALRHNRVEIKLSDEELSVIEEKAAATNLSKSAYLRRMGTVGEIKFYDAHLFTNLINQIRWIGNNINQIAKNANSTRSISSQELEKVLNYQESINNNLEYYYEKLIPRVI